MRLALCALLILLTARAGYGEDQLKVVGNPTITVDPLCNEQGKGSAVIKVRNEGTAAIPLYLNATDPVMKPPTKPLTRMSL